MKRHDAVICMKQGRWTCQKTGKPMTKPAPENGGIYTIASVEPDGLRLVEFPRTLFRADRFSVLPHDPTEFDFRRMVHHELR